MPMSIKCPLILNMTVSFSRYCIKYCLILQFQRNCLDSSQNKLVSLLLQFPKLEDPVPPPRKVETKTSKIYRPISDSNEFEEKEGLVD